MIQQSKTRFVSSNQLIKRIKGNFTPGILIQDWQLPPKTSNM